MYRIPWEVVLMMINDHTRLRPKKNKEDFGDPVDEIETYEPILSEAEADQFLKL